MSSIGIFSFVSILVILLAGYVYFFYNKRSIYMHRNERRSGKDRRNKFISSKNRMHRSNKERRK